MSSNYTLVFEPLLKIDVVHPDAQSVMLVSQEDFLELIGEAERIEIPLEKSVFRSIVEPAFDGGRPNDETMNNYYKMVLAPEFIARMRELYALMKGDKKKLEAAKDAMHDCRRVLQGSIYTILYPLCLNEVDEEFFQDSPIIDTTAPIGVDTKVTVAAILRVLAERGKKVSRVALRVALVNINVSEPMPVYFVWTPKP
jgi:hypothetical protein